MDGDSILLTSNGIEHVIIVVLGGSRVIVRLNGGSVVVQLTYAS